MFSIDSDFTASSWCKHVFLILVHDFSLKSIHPNTWSRSCVDECVGVCEYY